MAEPQSDDRAVHAGLQKVHSRRVSKNVDSNTFRPQRRAHLGCGLDMTEQQVMYAVRAETRATTIRKEDLAVTA